MCDADGAVASPNIQLVKTAAPSIECSGGTVTFCLWAVNMSSMTSAFNISLHDRLPDGMSYVPSQPNGWVAGTAGATFQYGFAKESFPQFLVWGSEPLLGDVSAGGQYYLRYVISMIGPGKSAVVCYKARIL